MLSGDITTALDRSRAVDATIEAIVWNRFAVSGHWADRVPKWLVHGYVASELGVPRSIALTQRVIGVLSRAGVRRIKNNGKHYFRGLRIQ